MRWHCILWALASVLAATAPGDNAAWALDLRDLQITVQANYRYESRDMTDGSAPTIVEFGTEPSIDAVGGKIVWIATTDGCTNDEDALWIVYSPAGAQSVAVGCKPVRQGTESCWSERSSQARYSSQMSVAGNVITLSGQMTGTTRYDVQGKDYTASDRSQFTIRQKLKLRIVGQTCQVLELNVESQEETIGTITGRSGANPTHTVDVRRITAGLGAQCTMARRSAQPVDKDPDDELRSFDGLCGDD